MALSHRCDRVAVGEDMAMCWVPARLEVESDKTLE